MEAWPCYGGLFGKADQFQSHYLHVVMFLCLEFGIKYSGFSYS